MPQRPNQRPKSKEDDMRSRIYGGARLELGRLSKDELEALHPLLVAGEAEIISVNCRPIAVRKLSRW